MCDHCCRADHPPERCFDLHPELRFGDRGRGKGAPQDRGGRDDGAGATGRPIVGAKHTIETAITARIKQFE